MSEDAMNAMQTFVAPELKAINVRLDHLEKQVAEEKDNVKELRAEMKEFCSEIRSELKEFRSEIKTTLADFERRAELRTTEIMNNIQAAVTSLKLEERIAKIEASRPKQIEQ